MRESGSQRALLVFSVIEIVCAALLVFGSLLAVAGSGMAGGALLGDLALKGQSEGVLMSADAAIPLVVLGAWGLLCGAFGIRAANDSGKIMAAWAFLLVGLILNAAGVIWSVVGGSFGQRPAMLVLNLVFDIVLLWIADCVKREAGE